MHQRTVKGINFLTSLYHSQGVSLPVGFVLIAKTEHYIDKKDGKAKRRSPINKNEHYRTLRIRPVLTGYAGSRVELQKQRNQ